jgi:hypothetical protein
VNCFSGSFQSIAFGPILTWDDSRPAADKIPTLRTAELSSRSKKFRGRIHSYF